MRSLSLTRSSAAPDTRERALGVRGGHGQGGHLVDERGHRRRAAPARPAQPRGARHDPAHRLRVLAHDARSRSRPPSRRSTSRKAVRRGFSSTPSMRTSESGRMSAATTRNAALETSPGTVIVRGPERPAARDGRRRRLRARRARRRPAAGARCGRGSGAGSVHRRLPFGLQPGEEDRGLHLRARHRQVATRTPRSGPPSIVSGRPPGGGRDAARPWPAAGPPRAPWAGGAATRRRRGRTGRAAPPGPRPASAAWTRSCPRRGPRAARARPPGPRPAMTTAPSSRRTSTPSAARQRSVEAQSAAVEKSPIRVSPSASAPRRASRCEIDLSPGRVKRPRKLRAGAMRTERGGSYHAAV